MNKIMRRKTNEQGFTLIEILVVIGIIAVLAAVVLIAINPARQFAQANNSQRTSNVNAILNAVGQYMADHQGQLPPGDIDETSDPIDETLCDELIPDYIPALPTDPTSFYAGESIQDGSCSDLNTNDSGYEIGTTSPSRVIVSAPNAQLDQTIEVTR